MVESKAVLSPVKAKKLARAYVALGRDYLEWYDRH